MQTALIYSKFIHVNMVNLTPAGNLVDKAVRNYRHLMEEKHIQHASSPQKNDHTKQAIPKSGRNHKLDLNNKIKNYKNFDKKAKKTNKKSKEKVSN
jgi:hypothetical protein